MVTNNDPTRALFKTELEELFSENTKIPENLGFEYIQEMSDEDNYCLHDSVLESQYGWCRLLEHRKWQDIDFLSLQSQQTGDIFFSELSSEAFAYYLPAFLYNLSRQDVYDDGTVLYDYFLYCLIPDNETYEKFFSNPKPYERIAIYKYLQILFEMDGTDFDFWSNLKVWDLAESNM